MSNPPQKASLYNVNDLKNITDDSLAPYLTSLPKPYKFTQIHTATDIRLVLGYSAVIIAGALFYADWKLGWDATKVYTAPACVVYFLLNGAFTYWIWKVEAGTVFVGVREGGQKLTIKSFSQKHKPTYQLKVLYEAPSGQKWEDKEVSGLFTEWFNVHGYVDQKAFKSWLARNIEVVGMADPSSKKSAEQSYEEVINDVTTATTTTTTTTAASSTGTETSVKKSRKKV